MSVNTNLTTYSAYNANTPFTAAWGNDVNQAIYKNYYDVRNAGGKGNGSAVDTSIVQEVINAAGISGAYEGRYGMAMADVFLGPGVWVLDPLTITKPMRIRGASNTATVLLLRSGSTSALFNVAVSTDGYDYFTATGLEAYVLFEDMTLISPNSIDPPGLDTAHGFSLGNASVNPVYTFVKFRNVRVYGMAGRGVSAVSFNGAVNGTDCEIKYCGGAAGLYANSCADWRWDKLDIGGSQDNMLLAGCAAFAFNSCNLYVPTRHNVNLFSYTYVDFTDCYLDLAPQNSLFANQSLASGVQGVATLKGCHLRYPSTSANNTYSAVYCPASSGGLVRLLGCNFSTASNPFSPGNISLCDLNVDAASTSTIVFDHMTVFDRGFPNAANKVTNGSPRIFGLYGSGTPSSTQVGIQVVGSLGFPGYSAPAPTANFTISASQSQEGLYMVPAGALGGTNTINFPPKPIDGQSFEISSSQAITGLVLVPVAPATTILNSATSLSAGQGIKYRYVSAGLTWARVY